MSSIERSPAQLPANKLYVNTASCISTIYKADGITPADWVLTKDVSTVGVAILRDMGKTVYLPALTSSSAGASLSTVLRKVQLVTNSGVGTGADSNCAPGEVDEFFTGFIKLPGVTYGGGAGVLGTAPGSCTQVARLN